MYPQDVWAAKYFHFQSILLAQNLQPVPKRVNFGIMKVTSVTPLKQRRKKRSDFSVYYIKTSTLTTFPLKFLSISIFADLISRWM